jgi:rifampin ADP-ribosylating transferase
MAAGKVTRWAVDGLRGGEQMAVIEGLNGRGFYHGTKADLKREDLIKSGFNSNFGKERKAAYVYLTATLDAATWGEVTDWQGHSPEKLKAMKDNLERLRQLGVEAIED